MNESQHLKKEEEEESATVFKFMHTSFHTDSKATEKESNHFVFTIVTNRVELSRDNSWIYGEHTNPTPISSVIPLQSTVWLTPLRWLKGPHL